VRVHYNMQYFYPPRSDSSTSPRSQIRLVWSCSRNLSYIPPKKGNLDMSTKLRMMSSSISESCGANWIHCDWPTLLFAGMSLNPIFTSIDFGQKAGELAPFASLGISLVHGRLVDPASAAVSHVEDYHSARDLIECRQRAGRGKCV
jgi:MINDY deubiquitinase